MFPTEQTPNLQLARKLKWAAWIVTVLVIILVGMQDRLKLEFLQGWHTPYQPLFHAVLNSIAALLLIWAFWEIKQKNIHRHKKLMLSALGVSSLFLVSYVFYHLSSDPISYTGKGFMRAFYFFILISHIGLATLSFPFILFSFIYALTHQIAKHRHLARAVFPIWLYVAITGPLIYLLLHANPA